MEKSKKYLGEWSMVNREKELTIDHSPLTIDEQNKVSLELNMNLTNDTYIRIVNAKLYIDENYHEPIDLEVVSKKAFISKFHFHRLFRKVYRQTPHQYITRKRIDKAKDLLAENKPVTEVCNEVGFESIGSFSILFKKEIGFAPTYYRNMAWLKKQEAKQQPKKFIPHCFIDSYKLDK